MWRKFKLFTLVFSIAIFSLLISFYISYSPSKLIFPIERFEYARNNPEEFLEEELEALDKIQYIEVEFDDIPSDCINAIISVEDQNFWTNHGVDRNGTLRLFYNLLPGNQNVGGGSTISQQLIKMYTDQYYNRTPVDKVKEIVWALRLNQDFTKEEIIEKYLNNIYVGEYNYGIGIAANEYFGKDISDLSRLECAYLMGLPQSPNTFLNDQEEWNNRKDIVLNLMESEGY